MPSLAVFRWPEIDLRPEKMHELRRAAGWWLFSVLAVIALVLLSRRLGGALEVPLSISVLLITGLALAAIARACRVLLGSPTAVVDGVVPLIALALTLPGSSLWGVALLWLVPLGEAISARRFPHHQPVPHPAKVSIGLPSSRELNRNDENANIESLADVSAADSSPTQRLTYNRDDTGAMTVHGWLRVPLLAGQRVAVVHTAFCPAFATAPQAEAEPTAGPDCTIRPTQILPWGIRWEIKLAAAASGDEQDVEFEFFAARGEET